MATMSSQEIKPRTALPNPSVPIKDNISISRKNFPQDFVFGTSTAAYQHEGAATTGGRGKSIWDDFTLRTPGRVVDGSNGNVAADMYIKYKDDIKMMKSMGFNAYRFSIAWPRLLPGGRLSLGVNKEGIDFYNDVIDTLLANGIEPYVTLFHWQLPLSLELEYGGFLCSDLDTSAMEENPMINDFREFVELCFWSFGDRVKNWITLNEPWTYAVHGYVECIFPPGNLPVSTSDFEAKGGKSSGLSQTEAKNNFPSYRHVPHPSGTPKMIRRTAVPSSSAKDVYTVARNLLLCHAHAVKSYRNKFQANQGGKIGMTLVSHWFEPLTDKPEDVKAANRGVDFMLGWFLEPVVSGQYPASMLQYVSEKDLKPFSEEESSLLKGSIDFLGLNYYTARYAENDPNPQIEDGYYKDQQIAFYTERDRKPIGPVAGSSWLFIVPWGIYELLKHINTTYKGVPAIIITENGVDEKNDPKLTSYQACVDTMRVSYHQDHLAKILEAMTDKLKGGNVNVKGYFVWSWCDNFEWIEGYTVRFGLIYIDFMNYLTRHPKSSAMWFGRFLNGNGLIGKEQVKDRMESDMEKA